MGISWNASTVPLQFFWPLALGALLFLGACEKDLTVYAGSRPEAGVDGGAADDGGAGSGGAGGTIGAAAASSLLASGNYFACAVIDGGARCWGDNEVGQLGNGKTNNSEVPVQVEGLSTGVTAISAANGDHACALVNGGVQCWGNNADGQLGDGTTANSAVPVQAQGLESGVTAIAVGTHHSCALREGGALCWGMNYYGQLGDGWQDSPVPVQVLDATGLSPLRNVQAITGGGFHTCAVVNGGAFCWGSNGPVSAPSVRGALGDDYASGSESALPVAVQGLGSGVRALAAGFYFTCAIVANASGATSMWCWGDNRAGQLGPAGPLEYSLAPVQVSGLPGPVDAIAAGAVDVCAIAGGGAFCWGADTAGQLGAPGATGSGLIGASAIADSSTPLLVTGLAAGASAIAVGFANNCALGSRGLECWGDNRFGEAGNDSTGATSPPGLVQDPASGSPDGG